MRMANWNKIKEGNYKLLSSIGSTHKPADFARIRSWGDKNSAITFDGDKVERIELLFVEGYGMVKNLPTTMHFCYEDKSKKLGRWVYMCTCGSPAGVISYKEIKDFITVEAQGYILACIAGVTSKQNTGIFKHADGSSE
jgi:hypothetical protein